MQPLRNPLSTALLAGFLLTGCATKHAGTYEVMAATGSADMASELTSHADTLWELRGDKAKLQEALGKYEEAYAANPMNRHVSERLVRGWYFLGDIYETDKDAKLAAWDTSITWGKRCLAINSEFTALLEKGDEKESDAARILGNDDVPCMYWTASALGKWAKLYGIAKALKHIGTVKAYISRVQELQPDFFYAAPDRYWGAYFSALPSFAGQDLDKSKEHFDKSIAMSPDYLGTRVLLADYWAVKTQNRAVFEENLNYVVNADPDKLPEVAIENRAEQEKAKALLTQIDDLFAK